ARRHRIVTHMRANVRALAPREAAFDHQLGARFRSERLALEGLFAALEPDDAEHPLAPGFELLRARSQRLRPLFGELAALERAGALLCPVEQLAQSYQHLTAFRLLRAAANAQELVLYDFLGRLYESRMA